MTENPFENDEPQIENDVQDDAAYDDIETVADDEDVEVLPETTNATEPAKADATPSKPKRPSAPEGYITPVAFAHKLTERLRKEGVLAEGEAFAPQQVYSWVKQGKSMSAKNPLKSYSEGGRDNLLKLDEAMAWYDAKEQRKAEAAAKKAEAAKAAAAKAQTSPQAAAETGEVSTEPVVEVE